MSEPLGHDLPDYVRNWPVREWKRARVYRGGSWWLWYHACADRPLASSVDVWPYDTWGEAYGSALAHARSCP